MTWSVDHACSQPIGFTQVPLKIFSETSGTVGPRCALELRRPDGPCAPGEAPTGSAGPHSHGASHSARSAVCAHLQLPAPMKEHAFAQLPPHGRVETLQAALGSCALLL